MDEPINQQAPNEWMAIPDPYKAIQDNLDKLNETHPDLQEFGRISFELFLINPDGKKLLELLEKNFVFKNMVDPAHFAAPHMALYWAGFADCIKHLKQNALSHKQRIEAV